MTIKDRILTFLKEQSISREDFYRSTELSASNFKGTALKSELGGDKIVKILTTYRNISPEWLLIGEGSMLKQNVQNETNSAQITGNALVSSDKDKQKSHINQEESSYLYKIYQEEKSEWKEEKREKDTLLKEKDTENKHLQSELRAMEKELAVLKARYQHPDEAAFAFTPGLPEAYTESSLPMNQPTKSLGTSSAVKI